MKLRSLFLATLILAPLALSACGTTCRQYVDGMVGYSSTRGRVTVVEQLGCQSVQHLADGVRVKVAGDGCRVTMDFGRERTDLEVAPGCVIVFGEDEDFILEPVVPDVPAARTQTEPLEPVGEDPQ